MIAKAIEKVQDLVKETIGEQVVELANGRRIYFMNGCEVARDGENRPRPLILHTLTALVDFIKDCRNNPIGAANRYQPTTIVVDDQRHVTLYSTIENVDFDRPALAIVEPLDAFDFRFNQFMPSENFIIGLQACFAPDANRDLVIEAVAGIKSDDSVSLKDMGRSRDGSAYF